MSQYIALRLRKLPAIYWASKPDFDVEMHQDYIVKTQHGTEVAKLLKFSDEMPQSLEKKQDIFVQEVLRPVDDKDQEKIADLKLKEEDASKKAKVKIKEHKLDMKLLKSEFLFDMSRVIFYFKSDHKVDFRELLKSLAAMFKTRIELRQIGVRDEAKLLGGIGCCGKEVCCHQFMTNFYPVSTRMAKEQNLSLNPAKLSGICGRLLCCLAHEHEYYASFHGKFPKISSEVVVGEETARVMDINYITRRILLGFSDRRKAYYQLDVIHGRKDSATGRNLWWIQMPEEEEPDLSILLRNLNPPGSGKKKKKSDSSKKKSGGNEDDRRRDSKNSKNAQSDNKKDEEEHGSDNHKDRKKHKKHKNDDNKEKKLPETPTDDENS
ncbi:MAG: PSP1 domain-containing protein [Candidatus Rifleibacteriota bacterium]